MAMPALIDELCCGGDARVAPPARVAPWAASAWAFAFAALSFYWGAGGSIGVPTLGRAIEERARSGDVWFILLGGWGAGVVKLTVGLLPLALVRPWGRPLPRRLVLAGVRVAGALLLLYGGANLVQHGLMEAGLVDTPDALGARAVRWHLLLWDPWWLVGGALFVAAAARRVHGASDRGTPPGRCSDGRGAATAPAPIARVRGHAETVATGATSSPPSDGAAWVAYAACVWAMVFGLPHLYWAVGGRAGLAWALAWHGPEEQALMRDPWFIAFGLWGVAALCAIAALVALASVRRWGRRFPRRLLLALAGGASAMMVLRACLYPGFLFSGLKVLGILETPESADPAWVRWDLRLFSPWFLLGGALFGATAWRIRSRAPVRYGHEGASAPNSRGSDR